MEKAKIYSDLELLEMIANDANQKEFAFKQIYSKYSSRVYIYCRKFIGENSSADDVFQDTFLRFLKAAESGAIIENVLGYLLKISRNLCINFKKSRKEDTVDISEIDFPIYDKTLESMELANIITMALELIPSEHKEAFVLQVYEGLSYAEIAEMTNVPLSTVRNRVVRAKSKLRQIIAPYLADTRKE